MRPLSFLCCLAVGSLSFAADLTRADAERLALANNPRIRVAGLLQKMQLEAVRTARSAELPFVTGNLSGVGAHQGSRITAGSLSASRLLNDAGGGVQVNQLVTDFGRTRDLVAMELLKDKARQADALASRQDILLAVDQLYFEALQSQATLKIADETVAARQTLADQVSALTQSKLRSTLDLSFVQVNLSQAKLLQLDARNQLDAAKATLNAVLGSDGPADFRLVEEAGGLPEIGPDPEALAQDAFDHRPDLQSLHYSEQAADRFAPAQKEQWRPSISALGVAGKSFFGDSAYFPSLWYGAAGVNISVPLFNGFRFRSQAAAASLEARAAAERSRDLHNQIARAVRVAWLTARTAFQRVEVSAELAKQADLALDLAQTRYHLGLATIVELSQAQLQQTQAAIGDANARVQYRLAVANLHYQTGATP